MDRKRKNNGDLTGLEREAKREFRDFTNLTNSWFENGSSAGTEVDNGGPGANNTIGMTPSGSGSGRTRVKQDEAASHKSSKKVLKACQNCRKSKIRCESQNKAKCKRCTEQNLECVYEMKVPTNATVLPDADWMSTVENRLDHFGKTLNTIVALLQQGAHPQLAASPQMHGLPGSTSSDGMSKASPPMMIQDSPERENKAAAENMDNFYQGNTIENYSFHGDDELQRILKEFEDLDNPPAETDKNSVSRNTDHQGAHAIDLRTNGTISFQQAEAFFSFFHLKISPHLFGFSTSHLELPKVWTRSPILVAAICTVASVHHPDFAYLFPVLKRELDGLARQVLLQNVTSEAEAVDTIVALCVAGFWLPDSSMLTSMALRLARGVSLNMADEASPEATERRLRLWYLIYILDGHQSLTYNCPPLLEANDKAASSARSVLLMKGKSGNFQPALLLNQAYSPHSQEKLLGEGMFGVEEDEKNGATLLSDIRLVSQVEFNQAVKGIFQHSAWDLIAPNAIGVPWKTNVELDKWMVAWACLLTPSESNHDSWSSKSTLIHYNFAKMHINSSRIRELQNTGISAGRIQSQELMHTSSEVDGDGNADSIALSAAQSVIRLSTSDKDILNALQYVPIHVHIMLYYAAMLVLGSVSPKSSPKGVRDAFRLVKDLKAALFQCRPPQDNIIGDITSNLNDELGRKSSEVQDLLMSRIDDTAEESSSRRSIAAWPGSISQHLNG